MNQNHSFMPSHGHMAHQSISSTTSAPTQYAGYQTHQPLHNAMPPYASSPVAYQGYSTYSSGIPNMNAGAGAPMMHAPIGLPGIGNVAQGPDGMPRPMESPSNKPKVTATLWEDENTLCFQVEARGVCVARREDNRMINGTKLLNVAGMTRGRRDGILKSEKVRHVIKIGPMHLKGVWIPFERALDFADREKITDVLYPLFVDNINALLYHPGGPARPGAPGTALAPAAVPDADRRKTENSQDFIGIPPGPRMPLPQYQQGAAGYRPLPTPPTSTTASISTPVTNSYEWGQPAGHLPSESINRTPASLLHTPIGTPPTSAMGNSTFPQIGGYERQYYGHSSQPSYSSQYSVNRFNGNPAFQTSPVRHEMAPPARNDERETRDAFPGQNPENPSSEAGDGEADAEYTHSNYAQQHRPYAYNAQNGQTTTDQTERPAQMGSPVKRPGQATPRTATPYQGYDAQQRTQNMPAGGLYYGGHARDDSTSTGLYNSAYQQSFPTAPTLNGNGKRGYEGYEDDGSNAKRLKSGMEERPQGMVGPTDR